MTRLRPRGVSSVRTAPSMSECCISVLQCVNNAVVTTANAMFQSLHMAVTSTLKFLIYFVHSITNPTYLGSSQLNLSYTCHPIKLVHSASRTDNSERK